MSEILHGKLSELYDLKDSDQLDYGVMPGSRCQGRTVFDLDGLIGADVIQMPPHTGFPVHTHPGHHVLLIVSGYGTLADSDGVHLTAPGDLLLIPGELPHAVGAAHEAQTILAIGAPHKVTADPLRMTTVDAPWTLFCHICHKQGDGVAPLHVFGCPHCPCPSCTFPDVESYRAAQAGT